MTYSRLLPPIKSVNISPLVIMSHSTNEIRPNADWSIDHPGLISSSSFNSNLLKRNALISVSNGLLRMI